MKITFKNGNVDIKAARQHLNSRASDIKQFITSSRSDDDSIRDDSYQEFCEYGLALDYVAPETFEDQNEGYIRFQISCGGPSEEIRLFYSPSGRKPYRIEFVYMDWGVGVGFDVTGQEWAQWLAEQWGETGTVEAKIQEALIN